MAYEDLARSAAVHFFIRYKDKQFAYRRMFMVPRVGDSNTEGGAGDGHTKPGWRHDVH